MHFRVDEELNFITLEHLRRDIVDTLLHELPKPRHGVPYKNEILPGVYNLLNGLNEEKLRNPEKMDVNCDEIIVSRSKEQAAIRKELDRFLEGVEECESIGLMNKRGIIIVGPPGSGKTVALINESRRLAKNGHVVFLSKSPYVLTEAISRFRKDHKDKPLFAIIEDIDEIIGSWGEHELLEMLGGMNSANNVMFIATTNHLCRLSSKMRRAGRFDFKIELPFPSAKQRMKYLEAKMPKESRQLIERIVRATEGMGFAHLREIIMAKLRYGDEYGKTIKRVKGDFLEEMAAYRRSIKQSGSRSRSGGSDCSDGYAIKGL